MARYNRIHLGPARENDPQVREAQAAASTLPGCLVTLNGSGKFALGSATTVGKVWLVQDNYLAQKGTDDAWEADETTVAFEIEEDTIYAARIPTGTNITAVGTALAPGASGKFAIAASGKQVVAYADEIYNNNTGSDQLIRVRAAGSNAHVAP